MTAPATGPGSGRWVAAGDAYQTPVRFALAAATALVALAAALYALGVLS